METLEQYFKLFWALEFTDEVKNLVARIVEKMGEDGLKKSYFVQQQIVHAFGSKYHRKQDSVFDSEEKIVKWLENYGSPR